MKWCKIYEMQGSHRKCVTAMGRSLLCLTHLSGSGLVVRSAATAEPVHMFNTPHIIQEGMVVSPDGRLLAVPVKLSYYSNSVALYDLVEKHMIKLVDNLGELSYNGMAFMPDSGGLLVTKFNNLMQHSIYSVRFKEEPPSQECLSLVSRGQHSRLTSNDSGLVVIVQDKKRIMSLDAASGYSVISDCEWNRGGMIGSSLVGTIKVSPKGDRALEFKNGVINSFSVANVSDVRVCFEIEAFPANGLYEFFNDASYSSDGKLIVACTNRGRVILFEESTGQEIFSHKVKSNVSSVSFCLGDKVIYAVGHKTSVFAFCKSKLSQKMAVAARTDLASRAALADLIQEEED